MNELFSAERFSKSEIAQARLKVVDFLKYVELNETVALGMDKKVIMSIF